MKEFPWDYAFLKEAIQQKDWGDAVHYTHLLKKKEFFEGKSRQGWRIFECEIYEVKLSHGIERFGCGVKFMEPTRDCFSYSISTCPCCGEEVHPSGGFYDDSLKVNSNWNLTNTPETIILSPEANI